MAKAEKPKSRWGFILGILLILFILGYIFLGIFSLLIGGISGEPLKRGNVALIPIKGVIMTDGEPNFFETGIVLSGDIIKNIEDATSNPEIMAIILEIDSPGGAPVATDEIATAIKGSNKTTVAWIREVGTSGAYWVASASEHIVANRMSITGSIGVIGSYLDFSGFINDWNVSYERLVGGKYKDSGTPFRKLDAEEKRMLQKKIDLLHQEFKDAVKKNRNLSQAQVDSISQGEFYLGSEAKQLGLVDELGGKQEAINFIQKKLNITAEIVSYGREKSLLELLAGMINEKSFYFGKGVGEGLNKEQGIGSFT
jgi:protease-4